MLLSEPMNLMMWKGLKSTFSRNHCLWRLIFGLCNLLFQIIQKLAVLHDAAEALRSHIGKGPGYRCMIGRSPNACFYGHAIELLL